MNYRVNELTVVKMTSKINNLLTINKICFIMEHFISKEK